MVNPMLLEFEVYRSGIRHRWRLVVPTPPLSLPPAIDAPESGGAS